MSISVLLPLSLDAPVEETRALGGVGVVSVSCDITTDEGRDKILSQCSSPDILINNAGGPPTGLFPRLDS